MNTAVIIVGIFKYDENILKEIIRCYSLDNKMSNIFIYNNNTQTNNDKIKNYFENNNVNIISIKSTKYNTYKKNNELYDINNNININWKKFEEKCTNKNIINNKLSSVHVPFTNPKFFIPHKCSPHQYEQIYLALNEIIEYENMHDFKYDYIMKIRLDFFLKHDKFGPLHYFNDTNDILLKSYDNLKYYYNKIDEEDNYHPTEFRINNYSYWRTTKFLGGQYILNKNSYIEISDSLNVRDEFNKIISEKFVITINDACFFSSGTNFKKVIDSLYTHLGEFYDENIYFWWTAECQFLLAILNNSLYYLDYIQNNNFYNFREMWVNDYHGTEKYDKLQMNTSL